MGVVVSRQPSRGAAAAFDGAGWMQR